MISYHEFETWNGSNRSFQWSYVKIRLIYLVRINSLLSVSCYFKGHDHSTKVLTLWDVVPVNVDVVIPIGTGLFMPEPEGVTYWENRRNNRQFTAALDEAMFYFIFLTINIWNMVLNVDWSLMASEPYFSVVLLILLYKVVLTFESVDEMLKFDHSNESYWAVLSCGAVYYAAQGGSYFWFCGRNPKVWPFKWKLPSSTFLWRCLCCTRWF